MRTNRRRLASLAVGLLAIGLLGTGCANNDDPSATPTNESEADPLAYSQCMRDHGIEKFPDPDANGSISIEGGPGLDPRNPEFKAAEKACESLLPPPPSDEERAKEGADALKYAKCMRDKGIENFPDPNAEGGINIEPGMGFDPESPQFEAADKACNHLMGGDGKRVTSQQGAGS
jgi:hypothetical protein